MLFGHVAISSLLHRYLDVDLKAAIAGGIFPDAVDKTLCQGLRLTPSGRMFAHTLLSLTLSAVGISRLWDRRAALGWSLGYLGHLVADSTGFVPWFYPFGTYQFKRNQGNLFKTLRSFLLEPQWVEWVVVIWAIWAFTVGRRRAD